MSGEDTGFSLVEIIVAIGVLMVVMVALLPQLVVGIHATGTAQLVTQAKGVAQGELEKMRNLPYHVSKQAGDFRDVLDTYFHNRTAPSVAASCPLNAYSLPQTSWSGFVSASGTRCDYEPAGAFYRKVVPVSAGGADFTVVVDTRFLSGTTPPVPVALPAAYDSQSVSGERPPSSQIGVIVTVVYTDRATVRAVSTYTQIAARPEVNVRARSEAEATALDVGSVTIGNGPVSLSAGQLNLAGSLTYTSTVHANLASTSAGLSTGEQASGASMSLAAPPTSSTGVVNAGNGSLGTTGCGIACWGHTKLILAPITAEDGLPQAGSQGAPMQALVTDKGGTHKGISFGNSSSTDYRPELKLEPPLLQLHPDADPTASGISAGCAAGGAGTSSYVTAAGYLGTTDDDAVSNPSSVEACAVASTSSISLFPTGPDEFAPDGVVIVELTGAMAHCTVSGTAHTADVGYDYSAVVKIRDPSTSSGYRTLATVTPDMLTDPLDAPGLLTTSVGGGRELGDYIASWSGLMDSEVTRTEADGVAEVNLPGVITIASQPTRPDENAPDGFDATSVVSVAVGALGCVAEDSR